MTYTYVPCSTSACGTELRLALDQQRRAGPWTCPRCRLDWTLDEQGEQETRRAWDEIGREPSPASPASSRDAASGERVASIFMGVERDATELS